MPVRSASLQSSSKPARTGGRRVVADAAVGLLAAMMYSVVLLVFTVAMLPSTGPPSERAAISASFFFLLVGAGSVMLVVITASRDRLVGAGVATGGATVLLAMAGWVGQRFERARLDGCFWGQGGGDQPWCVPQRESLPGVTQAWFVAAFVTSLILGLVLLWSAINSKRAHRTTEMVSGV